MWKNVVRVNGVVRGDMETVMGRQERLRQALQTAAPPLRRPSASGAGTCRVIREAVVGEVTGVLEMAGGDDAR